MRRILNEVARMKKIAGIISESQYEESADLADASEAKGIEEAAGSKRDIVTKLNALATSNGLKLTRKMGRGDIAKWVTREGNFVRLYNDEGGMSIHFSSPEGPSGNDPVESWLQPSTWQKYFPLPDSAKEEAEYIMDELSSDTDISPMEIIRMSRKKALEIVEDYGHTGQFAQEIADHLLALAKDY